MDSLQAAINIQTEKKDDALRLEPAQSQCFIAILEDALDQLAVLGDIMPDVRSDVPKATAEEIAKIIREQAQLQERQEQLTQELEEHKKLVNKTKFKETQMILLDVNNRMQQGTQALAKALKAHPSVAQNLLKIQTERGSLLTILSKLIRNLKHNKFTSLLETCIQHQSRQATLQQTVERFGMFIIHREANGSDRLKQMAGELIKEKAMLTSDLANRSVVIQQLKDTIQEINALISSEQRYTKKDSKAREASIKARYQRQEAELDMELALVNLEIENEKMAHQSIVNHLSRGRMVLEKEIQNWMQRYEEDTEKMIDELESLKLKRTNDLEKFEELVGKYEELEKHVEEYRNAKQREKEESELLALQTNACICIQHWWRKIRKEKLALSAKKKGGKKGAKKGKKK